MIGLGTMGRNFLLNIAEHGIQSVGYDLDAAKRSLLLEEGNGMPVEVGNDLSEFLAKLESPRNIMLLVPAGPIVDRVIADLAPHLNDDDLIIDGGNSHFTDTERREAELSAKGIGFMGVGVSGGEYGARHGASIMPGGQRRHYDRIEKTLQAVSAKVDGEPCVAYMGSGSAGHFVKMVHNGIEYGMMQLIAEAYDLLKGGYATSGEGVLTDEQVAAVFRRWDQGELNSFLVEITATVLAKKDGETGNSLVSMILDTAGQKGTGKWTSQAAMDLGVPVPTIDSAVTMRQISGRKSARERISGQFAKEAAPPSELDASAVRDALYAAFILTYAQGLSVLQTASVEKNYGLKMAEIAKIWRGGCIIRSRLLEDIRAAYENDSRMENLLLDDGFASAVKKARNALARVVIAAAADGVPAMCFSASLNYLNAFSTARSSANLIQAQRDLFGAHTYQRIDREGTYHTSDW